MLLALVDHIDEILPGGQVLNLSTYPERDREVNRSKRLEITSYTPLAMLLVNFPLALLIWLSRLLGMRGHVFARTRALRSMTGAAVVADLAGISFSDGRGMPTLIYNTLMTGIPLLLGVPVVKCSQAVGPFGQLPTRTAARMVLPRLQAIVARGEGTHHHLLDLGLNNVVEGADLAFSMEVTAEDEAVAAELVESLGNRSYFVVSASSVVQELCSTEGIDYAALMVEVIEKLAEETNLIPVLIAHSARPGQDAGRMNDLPVTREIAARSAKTTGVVALDQDLDPRVLRAIISGGRFLLTSRFHAMISGLATATPTVVVGWSHKYREVMKEFGLDRFVLPFSRLSADSVVELGVEANTSRGSITGAIEAELPRMKESSRVSFRALRGAIDG